jgi:chromosome segregation ATPase
MEFIADNAELFSGDGGAAMLEAFQSGDYDAIEAAMATQMEDQVGRKLEDVRRTLAVEMARVGDDRNEAYIKALQEYEAYLMDTDKLYEASLELQLEKEEAQLEEYRSYLEKEQEALEESLEKRKEAYESYFDSLEQEEEDQDYEEQASRLITNLSKLGSSSNADAKAKTTVSDYDLLAKGSDYKKVTLWERNGKSVIDYYIFKAITK